MAGHRAANRSKTGQSNCVYGKAPMEPKVTLKSVVAVSTTTQADIVAGSKRLPGDHASEATAASRSQRGGSTLLPVDRQKQRGRDR